MNPADMSHSQINTQLLLHHSMAQQPCDITFFDKPPILDAIPHERLFLALSYGAGAKKLSEMLEDIQLKSGETVKLSEIWVICPMPKGGVTQEAMDAVDLADGEQVVEATGKSIREMIRDTYKCQNEDETDRYVRRYLAS